jgi:hypothetical protein
MKNVTLAIDAEVLDKIHAYAAEQKLTVIAVVRQHFGTATSR